MIPHNFFINTAILCPLLTSMETEVALHEAFMDWSGSTLEKQKSRGRKTERQTEFPSSGPHTPATVRRGAPNQKPRTQSFIQADSLVIRCCLDPSKELGYRANLGLERRHCYVECDTQSLPA